MSAHASSTYSNADANANADTNSATSQSPRAQVHTTLMVFKPRNVLSATKDASDRATLRDLLDAAGAPPLSGHVGRLDFETSGLILVTTDSRLNRRLRNPVSLRLITYIVAFKIGKSRNSNGIDFDH